VKHTIEIAGKEVMIFDADEKGASNHFKEGFPNHVPGADYEYFSCGFIAGLNAPRPNTDPSMDKWIEELEEIASTKFGFRYKKGDLFGHGVEFYGSEQWGVNLEGEFTIQQLEAIINHMKRYQK
jgi:hypothetical protein